jgi:hypothetical protein
MAESICETPACAKTVYNFCGECGVGSCRDHAIPAPEALYEEGYVCAACAPKVLPAPMRALDTIFELMDGTEWDSETTSAIAGVLTLAGMPPRGCDPEEDDAA